MNIGFVNICACNAGYTSLVHAGQYDAVDARLHSCMFVGIRSARDRQGVSDTP